MSRAISTADRFIGRRVALRLATADDCTPRYVGWLQDPNVSCYLETRWLPQTMASVRAFVESMAESDHSYLFAIVIGPEKTHIGNIKIGAIDSRHALACVGYLIGERECWGRGLATEALELATGIGFERLGLHRLQAGVYGGNRASARVLEKAGYQLEARCKRQLRVGDSWDDYLQYGLLRDDWTGHCLAPMPGTARRPAASGELGAEAVAPGGARCRRG